MSNRWIVATVAASVTMAVACSDPPVAQPGTDGSPAATPTAPGADQPDPRLDELAAEVAALTATLETAAGHAGAAADASELPAARAAAEDAVHSLTAHPAWADDLDGDGQARTLEIAALLPGPQDAIEQDAFYGDQFARTLTAARAAGSSGGPVIDVLRDPIAGDLGIWQADAAGVLALIDDAADPTDLDAIEAAIADLPGSASRALTYALAAVRADDLQTATTAAERAAAHIDLMLSAVDELDLS